MTYFQLNGMRGDTIRIIAVIAIAVVLSGTGRGQHGVIREYAALAPKADAAALKPLIDEPLTDISITVGPDQAYYMTGSKAGINGPIGSTKVPIWRSRDRQRWKRIREIQFGSTMVCSPEIHFLKNQFWLTAGIDGGGTELLRFHSLELGDSRFDRRRMTQHGADPSLFLDDDGTFYWVMGSGEIARMKTDPMSGLASEPKAVIAPLRGDLRSTGMRGAFLAKIHGFYHLFIAERRIRHGNLGRTGLPGGTDDVFVAVSSRPDQGFAETRYLAFPHAGQTVIFRHPQGSLWATFSCTDNRGVFRLKPGAFPIEQVEAIQPIWPIGFAFERPDPPVRYQPQGILLRPDSSIIYEKGVGFLKPVPMEPVPGQRAPFPWIRDTSIIRSPDGVYYMTGTSGNLDAIHLWRSTDLKKFAYLTAAFTLDPNRPELWYNRVKGRLLWAPEIHRLQNTYWITWCVNQKLGMGLLKSVTGRPEGPYGPAYQGNHAFLSPQIDASLFQDDDGTPYFVWQGGLLRRLNREMSDFVGDPVEIKTVDGEQVGYEGIFMRKISSWYVVIAAEWNGGGNREDGTYDMMYSVSKKPTGPYTRRRVGVPHGGHSTLFQDGSGRWYLAFFGNDRTAPFRAMPGIVPLDIRDTGSDLVIRPALPGMP